MFVRGYLYIRRNGGLRVTVRRGQIADDEIALELKLNVPQSFFDRPLPVVEIDVPDGAVATDQLETTIDVSARTIARRLGLDADQVRDGLREMLDEQRRS